MSNIDVMPQAADKARSVRVDARPPRFEMSDEPRSRDQDMMFAWSIGVTTAVREREPLVERGELCPPEVYIG